MSLKAVTDAIAADLALSVAGVTFLFGGENLDQHGDAQRVVWVPRGGPTGAAVKPGATNPRRLRTRLVKVEAHVWGRSTAAGATSADHYAAAESLFNSLVASVHHVMPADYEVDSEEWPPLNGEQLAYGRVVVVTFTFRVPLVDATTGTATAKTNIIKTA